MRRSVFCLIAAILAALVLLYTRSYMLDTFQATENAAQGLGVALAISAARPYMLSMGAGAVFSAVAFFAVQRWAALVGGILFALAIVLLPAWAPFAVVPALLAFIGYARMAPKKE